MTSNDELRAKAEAAEPGPWRSVWAPGAMTKAGEHTVQAGRQWVGIGLTTQNADYIAAATPERVIALLDEIRELRAALEDIADNREGTSAHTAIAAVYRKARAALADAAPEAAE